MKQVINSMLQLNFWLQKKNFFSTFPKKFMLCFKVTIDHCANQDLQGLRQVISSDLDFQL